MKMRTTEKCDEASLRQRSPTSELRNQPQHLGKKKKARDLRGVDGKLHKPLE